MLTTPLAGWLSVHPGISYWLLPEFDTVPFLKISFGRLFEAPCRPFSEVSGAEIPHGVVTVHVDS